MNEGPQAIGGLVARIVSEAASGSASCSSAPAAQASVTAMALPAAKAAVDAVPSAPLAAALAASNGAIEPYRKADGTIGHRYQLMPAGARSVLAEARQRLDAVRLLLRPAPYSMVRTWCATLAAATETRDSADGTVATVDAMASLLEPMPAICFSRESLRAVAQASAAGGGWLPSYARVHPHLAALAAPLRDEAARLERLIAVLESPAPTNLLTDQGTGRDEVWTPARIDGWISGVEREPAGFPRATKCRAFLRRSAMVGLTLSGQQRARIETLRDAPYGEVAPEQMPPPEASILAGEALKRARERAGITVKAKEPVA